MQEGIVKPITNKLINFGQRLKIPSKPSDRQIVLAFYLVMAILFAGITLQAQEEHDFLDRAVSLLGTVTTCVYVMFFGLVYINIKPR